MIESLAYRERVQRTANCYNENRRQCSQPSDSTKCNQ